MSKLGSKSRSTEAVLGGYKIGRLEFAQKTTSTLHNVIGPNRFFPARLDSGLVCPSSQPRGRTVHFKWHYFTASPNIVRHLCPLLLHLATRLIDTNL
ncbi:unnamed protein product [Protopolystoma xenopodis]|uniref:Uncharacterized protein n=1 Tax=Protopolystoma xenopodis TaxID=117903 RepID=A0A3S4ZJD8_9PLAT|nr:unnamed protein product [Protopolystoma xenopodis]